MSSFRCRCLPGYSGKTCGIVVNLCAGIHCLNGGSCRGKRGVGMCVCREDYTGERCESPINPCIRVNCVNGGSCKRSRHGYQCRCPVGYTGALCELRKDYCHSTPCLHGGTCKNYMDRHICLCPNGLVGDSCEADTKISDESREVTASNDVIISAFSISRSSHIYLLRHRVLAIVLYLLGLLVAGG